jgi:hypothetical protein
MGFPRLEVPRNGNRFCRTLAYPKQPILLTPVNATARLLEVGTARHVMDEAPSAHTIEQPCTPHGGFSYTIQLLEFAVHGTEMAKLGPEFLRRISSIQPYSGDLPRRKFLKGLLCPGRWSPRGSWLANSLNDSFCVHRRTNTA